MSAPSNQSEYLALVRRSGVVEAAALDSYASQRESGSSSITVKELADELVQVGLLTAFQARQLLQGKGRLLIAGKYKVLDCLGSGGMGSVYLCEHKKLQRLVALKVLPASSAQDPGVLERFYREARAVARLSHPNIVGAHDVDQEGNHHYLVMEYIEGASLHEIVTAHGSMDITRACHYIAQAACGLQHAHEMGLIHRDIKPANLLLDRGGTVKILDLGLARFFTDDKDNLTGKYDRNTVLGTAGYLAPEQASDAHRADIRSDIYSLGLTLYYLLTGNGPFEDGTTAQKLIWQQVREPRPVREVRPEIPPALAVVLDRMIIKDPQHRYQTPGEVVAALAPWTQHPIDPPPESEMPKQHQRASGTPSSRSATPRPGTSRLPTQLPKPARGFSPRVYLLVLVFCLVLGGGGGVLCWTLFANKAPFRDDNSSPQAKQDNTGDPGEKKGEGSAARSGDLIWSAYQGNGVLLNAKAATGSSAAFSVPAGKCLFFQTALAPVTLEAGSSVKITLTLAATSGLSDATARVVGFGVFDGADLSDASQVTTGFYAQWNPRGGYFETFSRFERGALFTGKQLGQGGTYTGKLADSTTYTAQLLLVMNSSGDAVSFGRGASKEMAGVAVLGPDVLQTAYSKPAPLPTAGPLTLQRFAIKFHNTSSRDAVLSVGDLKVTPEKP